VIGQPPSSFVNRRVGNFERARPQDELK